MGQERHPWLQRRWFGKALRSMGGTDFLFIRNLFLLCLRLYVACLTLSYLHHPWTPPNPGLTPTGKSVIACRSSTSNCLSETQKVNIQCYRLITSLKIRCIGKIRHRDMVPWCHPFNLAPPGLFLHSQLGTQLPAEWSDQTSPCYLENWWTMVVSSPLRRCSKALDKIFPMRC